MKKMSLAVGQNISTEILDEIVERLVALASPVKIILFGSNARGEAKPKPGPIATWTCSLLKRR